MLTIEKVDTQSKAQVRRFISLPYRLYAGHPQWVPPLFVDAEMQLNRNKHPYYEHSDADFWVALRDGRTVGRIAALENRRFNDYHKVRQAQFYLFECEDDPEPRQRRSSSRYSSGRARAGSITSSVPKGSASLDGYGMLVEGFEHRQMMTMMNYNYEYYPRLVEALGFRKEVDFVSCYLSADVFHMPERVHRIAERAARAQRTAHPALQEQERADRVVRPHRPGVQRRVRQ